MQSKDIRLTESEQSEQLNVDSKTDPPDRIDASALFSADQFENYQLLSLIHSGTTGDVFKVLRIGLDKLFALKVFKPELLTSSGADERFDRECKAIASLTHENLVPVYEHGKSANGNHSSLLIS